jgi:transcription antitermination factor NusA-like protein
MEQHDHTHNPTVEEVPDEEDILHPPPSASTKSPEPTEGLSEKATGKQKDDETPAPPKKPTVPFNTASEELFPALGPAKPRATAVAPTWGKKSAAPGNAGSNGMAPGNVNSRSSVPAFVPAVMNLPGKDSDSLHFYPAELVPKNQLKKPLNDILRDINRRSKAKVECRTGGPNGLVTFTATGPKDAVHQALKDVANEVAAKVSYVIICAHRTTSFGSADESPQTTDKVSVPASVRPYIIGKGGAKIQDISKRTGARIQVPKPEEGEDEDTMIDVLVEGNTLATKLARREIDSIVKERTSTVNMRLKEIPAEYYPFLAGPHNSLVSNLEQGRDVRVQIPHYTTWGTQAPPQVPRNQPIPFVPQPQFPIQIAGDREQAQEVQAELLRQVERLRQQLAIEQRSIERGRHQFIVGDRGGSLHDFLEETGCSIILPPNNDDSETIYVVGPPDKIEAGVNKLEDLAASMQMAIVDATREHRGAHAQTHAHNLTRYLRQRQALQELERLHEASIVAPRDRHGPTAWEIYARNGKNSQKARGDIQSVFASHPPSRFSTVRVDRFYHPFLRQRNAQIVRDEYGVHLVFPEDSDDEDLVLVYEGQTPRDQYTIPRGAPSAAEVQAYQKSLQQAQQYIQNLMRNHQNIVSRDIGAPAKFYTKIERYVDKQQQGLPHDVPPVQVTFGDRRPQEARRHSQTGLAMRGPSNAVEDLASKILAFIEQEEKDELERGYTTTFDFPQKYANYLIGKRGENIRKLREEFDVDIQVNDGKVELKGPQAKANACKAHILAFARKLEDEATYTLKIKPHLHRDLIGPKGSQVNRLQDRYKVRINFPRSTNANDDDAATEGGASQRNFRAQAADEVTIRGPRKGADEAREEILNLVQWITDNSYTDTVSVAQSQIPSLIGAGGREMDNLRLTTGAQIDVPGAKDNVDPSGRAEIKIKGTKKQVEDAKKLLQERAKEFDNTVVKTIDVDRKHHRTLIGPNGKDLEL